MEDDSEKVLEVALQHEMKPTDTKALEEAFAKGRQAPQWRESS